MAYENKSFSYLPHTEEDRREMLKTIGVRSFEELVAHIPENVRAGKLDLEPGLSEIELREKIGELAAKGRPASAQKSFLGGGAYRRFVPAAVPALVLRGEFSTAYTPYQPEVSQGTLQAIYEFQTAICLLTGMEVANASMYDGPTACAEAALMACRLTGRSGIIVADTVNPEHRQVTETYGWACNLPVTQQRSEGGIMEPGRLTIGADTAAVIVQYPNYFGGLEDLPAIAERAHAQGALLIVVSEPISLGVLTPPGLLGADIVVGDAQPCGNSLSFGGPSAGYMATWQKYMRQLPGRLAGLTVDNRGQRAFTLTLQTREQHIRRAKATSNICTNQALNALTMLVYLTLIGPAGLAELSNVSVQRAHYLAEKLSAVKGVRLPFAGPYFNEFVIETPLPAETVLDRLREFDILGGLALSQNYKHMPNAILVCVTEMNPASDLDHYAHALSSVVTTQESSSVLATARKAKA